jgi:hypothetical protein
MGVAKLHFDVLSGLYVPSGDIITSAVRRAVSHPATAGFVKRAVDNGEEPVDMDMPVWGIVLLGVSFYAAIIGMSLVSLLSLVYTSEFNANPFSVAQLHAQGSRRHPVHGRDPSRRYHNLPV